MFRLPRPRPAPAARSTPPVPDLGACASDRGRGSRSAIGRGEGAGGRGARPAPGPVPRRPQSTHKELRFSKATSACTVTFTALLSTTTICTCRVGYYSGCERALGCGGCEVLTFLCSVSWILSHTTVWQAAAMLARVTTKLSRAGGRGVGGRTMGRVSTRAASTTARRSAVNPLIAGSVTAGVLLTGYVRNTPHSSIISTYIYAAMLHLRLAHRARQSRTTRRGQERRRAAVHPVRRGRAAQHARELLGDRRRAGVRRDERARVAPRRPGRHLAPRGAGRDVRALPSPPAYSSR